jgi:glycosyltransferase involved in cell wall biosynthesis
VRILFVVKEFPHSKVIGGPIIIYNRVKLLSRRHEVSLVAFAADEKGYTEEQQKSVSMYCENMRILPPPPSWGKLQKARQFFFSKVPPYFWFCRSEEMFEQIADMTRTAAYDVVISEYSMVAQYLYENPSLDGIKRVMSEHECYYLARRKVFEMERCNKEGLTALFYMKGLKRYEFDMYADADRVLTLTPEGRDELLAIRGDLDISVVPHGVDVDSFKPVQRPEGPPTIMFLGNYPHDPNRDAFMFFAEKAWPRVLKEVPGAKFLVVGRGPTPDMLEVAKADGSIEITGQVDDVRPYFARSDVFVCPVRMGGGFRGKVLEAMAMAIPVVSTPLGAEGLPARDGENMLLAETAEALAEATVKLLGDKELSSKLGTAGRDLVVRNYSWQRGVEILEEVLEEVVGKP